MSNLPVRRSRLVSFGGETSNGEVVAPADVDHLIDALHRAGEAGRRVTFRGGGHAFDSQSLNDDLVISLACLDDRRIDAAAARAELGAGVKMGVLLDDARAHGLLPHIMVTTEGASVGGTAAGNCVSRFSALHGQDGDWVRAVELVTMTGERLTLTPADEAFHGVIGGLGYLGAITRVTLELQRSTHDQVETTTVIRGRLDEVLSACGPDALPRDGVTTRYAVLRHDLEKGMVYQSRYVTGEKLRRYYPVHVPRSLVRMLGDLVISSHLGSRVVWHLGYRTLKPRYVDPIRDFTFFMDGNARLRRLGRRLGRAMRIVQQSFVLPVATTQAFIEAARRVFHDARLVPSMCDVLHCLPDRALLSATHGRSGFFVSFAFQPWLGARHRLAIRAFRDLSRVCADHGGRVHLTKTVHAEPEVLQSMYAETLPAFRAHKQRFDPELRLRNAFLERIFPSLLR